jgi:hypothetical protein
MRGSLIRPDQKEKCATSVLWDFRETRSIDIYIWIECLEQYLKSLWREVANSALLRVDQRWFESHKTLYVALKILLNLFFHEFWQIDTDCLAAFRQFLIKKYCPLDVSATCMRIFKAILILRQALAVRSELHNFDWDDFEHGRVHCLIWELDTWEANCKKVTTASSSRTLKGV